MNNKFKMDLKLLSTSKLSNRKVNHQKIAHSNENTQNKSTCHSGQDTAKLQLHKTVLHTPACQQYSIYSQPETSLAENYSHKQ